VLLVSALYSVLSLLFTNAARTQLSSLSLHDALPIFTTGEAWPDIAATVMEDQPLAWVFFLVFILVSTFVVLNLFLAVVVDAMESVRVQEAAAQPAVPAAAPGEHASVQAELAALRREIAALREELTRTGTPATGEDRSPVRDAGSP